MLSLGFPYAEAEAPPRPRPPPKPPRPPPAKPAPRPPLGGLAPKGRGPPPRGPLDPNLHPDFSILACSASSGTVGSGRDYMGIKERGAPKKGLSRDRRAPGTAAHLQEGAGELQSGLGVSWELELDMPEAPEAPGGGVFCEPDPDNLRRAKR